MENGYIGITLRSKIEYLLSMKNKNNDRKYYTNIYWLLDKMDKYSNKKVC